MGMSKPWYNGNGALSISIFDNVGLHILSLKDDGRSIPHVQTIRPRQQSPKAQVCLGTFRGVQTTWKSQGLECMTLMDPSRLAALRYFVGVEDRSVCKETSGVFIDSNLHPTILPSSNEYCHVDEQSGIVLFPVGGWFPRYHVFRITE